MWEKKLGLVVKVVERDMGLWGAGGKRDNQYV